MDVFVGENARSSHLGGVASNHINLICCRTTQGTKPSTDFTTFALDSLPMSTRFKVKHSWAI
jgi:hypothetical protein